MLPIPITITMHETFDGILWVGDPHVKSTRPGRRKDNYLQSVLGKLEEAAAIANAENLLPVFLGDLLDSNDDNSLKMLNRLVRVLQKFHRKPLCLPGNHDMEGYKVEEDDAMTLLSATGVVELLDKVGSCHGVYVVEGRKVGLWPVPFGQAIPQSIEREGQDVAVLVTHHDLAFEGSYPTALPLRSVEGADMAVNGHMHGTKPSVQVGGTHWHNPGNIEPLSVDMESHVPRVWSWKPSMGTGALRGHELSHGTDLFNKAGLQVQASDDAAGAVQVLLQSEFVKELNAQSALDAERTDDASILAEDLEEVLQLSKASEAAAALSRLLILPKSAAQEDTVEAN